MQGGKIKPVVSKLVRSKITNILKKGIVFKCIIISPGNARNARLRNIEQHFALTNTCIEFAQYPMFSSTQK